MSVDGLSTKYPELSTYQYASNSPIESIDVDGLEQGSNKFYNQNVSGVNIQMRNPTTEAVEIKVQIHTLEASKKSEAAQTYKQIADMRRVIQNSQLKKQPAFNPDNRTHDQREASIEAFKKKQYMDDLQRSDPFMYGGGDFGFGFASTMGTTIKEAPLVVLPEVAAAKMFKTAYNIKAAVWAQKTFSNTFSVDGTFTGLTVDGLAAELKTGAKSIADVPINVVVRDGQTYILNTRSSAALTKAGIPRSQWKVFNQTGNAEFEAMLNGQLERNGLQGTGTNTIKNSTTGEIFTNAKF